MSTPDDYAATLPASTWKDRPLPVAGRKIKIKYAVKRDARTIWETAFGKVENVSRPQDNHLIVMLHNGKSYLIDSGSLLDTWEYTDEPVYTNQAVIDLCDPDNKVEHENRLANDPLYRQYWSEIEAGITGEDDGNPFGPDLSEEPQENVAPGVPDPDSETLSGCLRRLAYLDDQMKSLNAQVGGLKAEYDKLSALTLERMAMEGVPAMTVDGYTWFMKETPYVEKIDGASPDDIREALVASGLSSMVTETYSGSSLRSLLREYEESGTPLPRALSEVVRLSTVHAIGRTRAAARKRKAPSPLS